MRIKRGVRLKGDGIAIGPEIAYALGVSRQIFVEYAGVPMTVTSVLDGKHKTGSLHYKGKAADLRTRNMMAPARELVHSKIRSALYVWGFDVVLETDHIHIEYDPKPGREWTVEVD